MVNGRLCGERVDWSSVQRNTEQTYNEHNKIAYCKTSY